MKRNVRHSTVASHFFGTIPVMRFHRPVLKKSSFHRVRKMPQSSERKHAKLNYIRGNAITSFTLHNIPSLIDNTRVITQMHFSLVGQNNQLSLWNIILCLWPAMVDWRVKMHCDAIVIINAILRRVSLEFWFWTIIKPEGGILTLY